MREDILNAVKAAEGTREIEMLNIRPHVAKKNYCFQVFECNLGKALGAYLEANGIKDNECLVVTSPRAHGAAVKALPQKYYYTYVTDTKTDKLDRFFDECGKDEYTALSQKERDELDKRNEAAFRPYAELLVNRDASENQLKFFEDDTWIEAQKFFDERATRPEEGKYHLNRTIENQKDIKLVIALGGGIAMDAGQYIASRIAGKPENLERKSRIDDAWNKDVKLICIPTVLSVNAAFCYKAALREKEKVADASTAAPTSVTADTASGHYEVKYFSGLVQPEAILIDPDIILTAGDLNVVGSGDLLSCLTASFDWKLNSLIARNYHPFGMDVSKPFNQEICDGAKELVGLLAENIDNLNAMRDYAVVLQDGHKNDKTHYDILNGTGSATDVKNAELAMKAGEGLRFLGKAYHWVAEQSWIMQHTMWESASEHGMFDYMEYLCGTEFKHGQIIGLCVYFMSRLQENEHDRAVSMIKRLKLDITLNNLAAAQDKNENVTLERLIECLIGVKNFLTKGGYRYTIISAKDITNDWIKEALRAYYKDFPMDYNGRSNKGSDELEAKIAELLPN